MSLCPSTLYHKKSVKETGVKEPGSHKFPKASTLPAQQQLPVSKLLQGQSPGKNFQMSRSSGKPLRKIFQDGARKRLEEIPGGKPRVIDKYSQKGTIPKKGLSPGNFFQYPREFPPPWEIYSKGIPFLAHPMLPDPPKHPFWPT